MAGRYDGEDARGYAQTRVMMVSSNKLTVTNKTILPFYVDRSWSSTYSNGIQRRQEDVGSEGGSGETHEDYANRQHATTASGSIL